METGAIPDEAITASSSYVPNVGPKNGRLRVEKAGGAWCPKQQVEKGIREYIQVDLQDVYVITGIQTQGRYDRGRGQEYAEEYTLEYWRPSLGDWKEYKRWDGKKIFAKAKILFSIGGKYYSGRTLSYAYMPDNVLENARNVSIHLHNRLARFIKIRLYFAAEWIMLSEVAFDSVPFATNITNEEIPESEEDEFIVTSRDESMQDSFETISARKDDNSYVEVIVGVLTAIMLLLLIVFVIILILSRRNKFQGSPSLLRNPFGVTINMKDLLMNLSSGNNLNSNSHPITPVSQGPPSDPPSASLEEYKSSLIDLYYASNSNNPRCSSSVEDDSEEPPEVPPLPSAQSLEQNSTPPSETSPTYYKSLENTPNHGSKSNMINLGNYFPKITTDAPGRKLYNTAPREKQRVPPPVVCWNIAPSMGQSYNCKEIELVPIPRYSLVPLEKLGCCHAGGISLYETVGLEDIITGVGRLVVVRAPNSERIKTGLSDPNICKVLGVCTAEQPPWTIIEYGEMGDLAQYLQFIANKSGTTRLSNAHALNVDCLMYMAVQIASGMKYLETKHVVHKDLAARNCLVGRGYAIKVADIAICKIQYRKDYAEIGGRPPAPIRWLPWESILLERYTCSSSVWSFAVTLWEILSFACEKPFNTLTNEKVIQNAEHMYYGGGLQVLLNKPPLCSTEIYELMCECWKRDDTCRPTFKQIYSFLKRNNKEYIPTD
ncbi:hypothetical protein FQA39_LY17596 [Lamprigera yunnana]|nr:hypothetical protein FQA39_LY17596 [Lamprigera yunnana]